MATSKEDISGWFDAGKKKKAGFMIIVCDTFDYGDYPVYADREDFKEKYTEHDGKNMQRIMEVYNLSLNKDLQMKQKRVFHFPKGWSQ